MKKISIFLSALSLSLTCSSLMAQNVTSQVTPQLNNTDVPDYNHLPPGIDLLKNGIRNRDGSVTIKAGQQTPEANEINRRYCASLGGIDATNETDQTIGTGTHYAVVCKDASAHSTSAKTPVLSGNNLNPFGKK